MVSTTVFRVMVEYVLSYCSDAFGIYEWTFGMHTHFDAFEEWYT